MARADVPQTKVQRALQSLMDHSGLIAIVNSMAREIERLNEDNAQLRAAVSLYREVVRKSSGQP
jgi:hypothetical protein